MVGLVDHGLVILAIIFLEAFSLRPTYFSSSQTHCLALDGVSVREKRIVIYNL